MSILAWRRNLSNFQLTCGSRQYIHPSSEDLGARGAAMCEQTEAAPDAQGK